LNGEKVKIDGRWTSRPLRTTPSTGEMYSTMVEGAPGHDQELLKELRTMTGFESASLVCQVRRGEQSWQHARARAVLRRPETVKSAWKVILEAAENTTSRRLHHHPASSGVPRPRRQPAP